jgi:hypothetical protein
MLNSKMLNWKREFCVMIKLHVDLALQQQQQQKRQSKTCAFAAAVAAALQSTKLEPDNKMTHKNTPKGEFDGSDHSIKNHVGNSLLLLQNCWQNF